MFLALLNVSYFEGFGFRLLCHPDRRVATLKDFCFSDVMHVLKRHQVIIKFGTEIT